PQPRDIRPKSIAALRPPSPAGTRPRKGLHPHETPVNRLVPLGKHLQRTGKGPRPRKRVIRAEPVRVIHGPPRYGERVPPRPPAPNLPPTPPPSDAEARCAPPKIPPAPPPND